MAHPEVLRNSLKIKGTLLSGAGDPLLTRNPGSKEVRETSASITSLPLNNIFVGNVSSIPTAVAVTGDVTLTGGNFQINPGAIVNADINAAAAIAVSKLAAMIANRAVITDASGFLTTSVTTATEIGYSSGLSSNIQVQLNNKQATITGAASTVVTSNLTANRALISNGSGKIDISPTTSTELSYVNGVTSAIQTQINSKLTVVLTAPAAGHIIYNNGTNWVNLGPGANGTVLTISGGIPIWTTGTSNGLPSGGTTNQYLRKNSNTNYDAVWDTLTLSKITDVTALAADVNLLAGQQAAGLTGTEIGYLNGVTSSIQTQFNNKLDRSLAYNAIFVGDASNIPVGLPAGINGDVLSIVGGAPVWAPPSPGSGVSGVAPTTDNAIARWNGTLGTSIQNSGVIIDDSDNITGIVSATIKNQGSLILNELTASGTNFVALRAAGTMAADYTITLPAAAPGANTFLKYDGANYSWAAGGGGATVFTGLADVPASYAGQANKVVAVNPGETGLVFVTAPAGTVTSVTGTANRITSTGGTTPVIDIAATYVGQTSITTLGTVGTGTWNATNISLGKGGTGAALIAPGSDSIFFYDQSAGSSAFLSIGGGLAITGTTLSNTLASSPLNQYFTADNTTTVFTLTEPSALAITLVTVGGFANQEGVHYTKNNITKQVTFVTPPLSPQKIGIYYLTSSSIGSPTLASGNGTTYTGTAVDLGGTITGTIELPATTPGSGDLFIGTNSGFANNLATVNIGSATSTIITSDGDAYIYGAGSTNIGDTIGDIIINTPGGNNTGDIYYVDNLSHTVVRPIGTTNQVLSVVSGVPNWRTIQATDLSMSSGFLLGRTTAGTGVVQNITVGSGLTFNTTTLSLGGATGLNVNFTPTTTTNFGFSDGSFINVTGATSAAQFNTGAGFTATTQDTGLVLTRARTSGANASFSLGNAGGIGVISAVGDSVVLSGGDIQIAASDAYTTSGNGNGGNLFISTGLRRTAGSGIDGTLTVTAQGGVLIQSTSTQAARPFRITGYTSHRIDFGSDSSGDVYYRNGSGLLQRLGIGSTGQVLTVASGAPSWATPLAKTPLYFAASDETTPLSTGTAKVTLRAPYAMTITGVTADLVTAQTAGSIFTVDIKVNGSSILSTKITIDNTEDTSVTAATPPVLSSTTLAYNDKITVDIIQVGSGTATGLKINILGT